MKNRVITISREFGSGGRTIGKMVAQRLGIPCYDAEIIEKIAQESGYSGDYIKNEGEGAGDKWLSNLFSNRSMGPTNQDKIWLIQSRIITRLAEKSPCVIVGRCADYVLRDKADLLNVFIHATPEKRAERIVREYGERDASPLERIREKDRRMPGVSMGCAYYDAAASDIRDVLREADAMLYQDKSRNSGCDNT